MKKILIIEDDKFLVRISKLKLEKEGYQVSFAEGGADITEAIGKEVPNLIMLDLILPDKNGFDVVREIRKNPATADVPIIALTDLSEEQDMSLAKKLGVTQYVVKSQSSFSAVVEHIHRLIGS